jgi:hypothetical protein
MPEPARPACPPASTERRGARSADLARPTDCELSPRGGSVLVRRCDPVQGEWIVDAAHHSHA